MKSGKIKKFFDDRGFGFIRPDAGGRDIFFHMYDGRQFHDDGTDTPVLVSALGSRARKPDEWNDEGASVLYKEAPGKNGQPKACFWGYSDDYDRVCKEIAARKAEAVRREQERLRCDPLFRLWEQPTRVNPNFGRLARVVFTGTRSEFLRRFPTGSRWDQVISSDNYLRGCERETATGWEPCGDPRMLKLSMTFDAAKVFLSGCDFHCLRDRVFGDEEFHWTKDGRRVASGYYGRRNCDLGITNDLIINETEWFAETSFGGKEAKALYDAGGKTRNIEFNDAGDPREMDQNTLVEPDRTNRQVADRRGLEGMCCECQRRHQIYMVEGRWVMSRHDTFGSHCVGSYTRPQVIVR